MRLPPETLPPTTVRSFPRRVEYPLSLQQLGIWNWCQIHPETPAYNYSSDFHLRGELDAGRLHRALAALFAHHEILAATFPLVAGRPVQRFGSRHALRLPRADLTRLEPPRRERQIHLFHRRLGLPAYDLESGPLTRFLLVRTGEREHRLLFAFHHLVLDGPGLRPLCRTLMALYAGLGAAGEPPAPPALRYRDFVLWQEDALRRGELAADESYWLERFHAPLPELELPTDRPRTPARTFRGGRVEVPLDADLRARLEELQGRLGVTAFRLCLAAFQVLLNRLSGQSDLIVGVPATAQPRELTNEVGLFIGTLPVRTALDGGEPFSTLVGRVGEVLRQAHGHRRYPFEAVVGRLGLERDPHRLPVYSVACTQVVPVPRIEAGGLELSMREVLLDWALFDLNLSVRHESGALELVLYFDRDVFAPDSVAGMAESLAALLSSICRDPEQALDRLEFHTPAQRRRLQLGPRPRLRLQPLAFNQRDLWAQYMLLPPNPWYNCAFAITVDGPTTADLRRAAVEVVARHEILGATFRSIDGRPWMRFAGRSVRCPVDDLSGLSAGAQAAALAARERAWALAPFDLERGPLIRLGIGRLAPDRHRLILVIHHLLNDQPAQGELLREIAERAVRLQRGETAPPAPLAVGYRDFAVWQNKRFLAGDLAAHGAYWRRELTAPLPLVEPPTDRARGAVQTYRGEYVLRWLPADLLRDLQGLRASAGVSLFRLLLAAFAVLVRRWCGAREMLLAVPVSTRPRELGEVSGYFSIAVPIRLDLRGEPRFRDLVDQVDRKLRAAAEHCQYPLVEIYRQLDHEPGRPLFPVCVSQTRPLDGRGDGYLLRDGVHDTPGVVFDLWVLFEQSAGALELKFKYNTDLFERASIERLTASFVELLASVVRDPEARISRLRLLSEAARRELEAINRPPGSGPPAGESAATLIARRAALRPDAVAAVEGERRLTYGELAAAAGRVAAALAERGAGLEGRVAVLGRRGLDLLEVVVGIAWAGAVYVPLEPEHPDARLRTILEDCCARWLLAGDRQRPRADRLAAGLEPAVEVVGWSDLRHPPDVVSPPAAGRPDGLANVFYTSGSTGRPKGAMVTRRGMLNHLWAKVELLGLDAGAAVAQNASLGFDISIWQMLAPLLVGGRTVIYDDPAALSGHLLERVDRDRVTVLETVPSLLEVMLAEVPATVELAALRHLVSNAETLSPALARRWSVRFPRTLLVNTYGATECSDDVTHQLFDRPPGRDEPRVGVGGPIPGMRVHVVGRHSPDLLPVGWPGEIALGGVGVGRGYLGDPRKTARAFIPDPWSREPGGRLYRTGDLGRFAAGGHLDFLGRLDHQVKVRGHRIELGEVEAALLALGGVRQAVAVVRADGAGRNRLVAYVVLDDGVGTDAVRDGLGERLPASMLPDDLVALPALPLTPNGKVDRTALPAPVAPDRAAERVAPRTALERKLVDVWREVLGEAAVGVHDNFFALGGDSIRSIQMAARLRREGLRMEPRLLFQSQTVAGLARALEEAGEAVAEPREFAGGSELSAGERAWLATRWGEERIEAAYPLSPIQQGMLFHTLLEPEHSPYQEQVAHGLLGPLDVGCLLRALALLVRRHPLLRTVFVEGSRPLQAVLRAAPAPSSPPLVCDLRGLPPAHRERARERVERELFRRPLAPTERPPLRIALLLVGDGESLLVWTFNHVLLDGWSSGLLLQDLMAIYRALRRGVPPPPAEFPPYRRFLDWLAAQDLDAARGFWRRRLAGFAGPTPLPADRSPDSASRGPRRQAVYPVSGATLASLRRFGAACGAAPSFVWQAAWAVLLARAAGADEATFGLVLLGRPEELTGADRMVGPFITTVPQRVALPPTATPAEVVGELMRRYPELSRHGHLALAEIQALSDVRSPARLFESILDIHRSPGAFPQLGELRLVHDEAHGGRGGTSFDLAVDVVGGEAPLLRAHFAPEVFDAATVERLLASLEAWAVALANRPEAPLAEIRPQPARGAEDALAELEGEVLDELAGRLGG